MAAKQFAKMAGIPIIYFKQSGTESKWVGETAKNMEAVFRRASQFPKCIVLIDEMGKLNIKIFGFTNQTNSKSYFQTHFVWIERKKDFLKLRSKTTSKSSCY